MIGVLMARIAVITQAAIQFVAMDGFHALPCLLSITKSAIVNGVIDVGDVGDVGRLMNDLRVLPLIDEHGVQAG